MVSALLPSDSEPVYCPGRCIRGRVYTSGPLTRVHMLALCPRSACFKLYELKTQRARVLWGGNRQTGWQSHHRNVFQGPGRSLSSSVCLRCTAFLTKKWGDTHHPSITSAGPPSGRLACNSQAAAVQHPAVAWGSSGRQVCTAVQGGIAACPGDLPLRRTCKRRGSKGRPGGALLCPATRPSVLPRGRQSSGWSLLNS